MIAYHVRQSFCPGEITPEEANRLGVEFAKRFTKGMVDHAEYIIGVFDNQKKLRSGTAQTVNYALHQGKVITLIHPDTMEITAPAP